MTDGQVFMVCYGVAALLFAAAMAIHWSGDKAARESPRGAMVLVLSALMAGVCWPLLALDMVLGGDRRKGR